MKSVLRASLTIVLSSLVAASTATAAATPLPAGIGALSTAVQAAYKQQQSDAVLYMIDIVVGDTGAAALAKAAINTARIALDTSVTAYLSADEAAMAAAEHQLRVDFELLRAEVKANKAIAGVQAQILIDFAAVQAADAQLNRDLQQLAAAGIKQGCESLVDVHLAQDSQHGGH